MSDIIFDCPLCSASLKVDASAVGMRVDCPTCGKEIEIPSPDALAPPPAFDGAPSSEPTDRAGAESQHQGTSTKRSGMATEPDKRMPLSTSEFRSVLEDASAKTVKQIEEASRQAIGMIGD